MVTNVCSFGHFGTTDAVELNKDNAEKEKKKRGLTTEDTENAEKGRSFAIPRNALRSVATDAPVRGGI